MPHASLGGLAWGIHFFPLHQEPAWKAPSAAVGISRAWPDLGAVTGGGVERGGGCEEEGGERGEEGIHK